MNISSEIISCRICLATNRKMYDMFSYQLKHVYENLVNVQVTFQNYLPHHICVYCTSLLLKFSSFKDKCLKSQDLLQNSTTQNKVTLDDKKVIDITQNIHPYSISYASSLDIPPVKVEGCTHNDDVDDKNDYLNDKNDYSNDKNDYFNNDYDDMFCVNDNSNLENETLKDIKNNEIVNIVTKSAVNDSDNINSDEEPLSKKRSKIKIKKKKIKDIKPDNGRAEIDVIVLSKEQQIKEIEDRKKSFNYLNSYYKCDYCYKGFVTEGTYKNHMLRHDLSSGPIVCEICNTRWPDTRALRAHTLVSHTRKYVCRLCNNISRNLHKAREHQNWHSGFKFVCNICGAVFNKSTTHLTHLRMQHPSQHSHACETCGEVFISGVGLSMHKKKAHKDNSTRFECAICKVQFANEGALVKHSGLEISCTDSKLKACVKCGENFQDELSLKSHLKTHQKDDAVDCQFCHRSFSNERTFSVHYQRFHVGKLKRERCHARRQDLVCEMCGVKCMSKTMLLYHQRTHTGEKPYQCTECPKSFRIYQSLQIHLRTHTGESPFKCSQCPKAFKHKAGLNRHTRVHTGAKPYSCPHCTKSFSQSNSMKLHVTTVHLKMPAPYKNRVRHRQVNEIVESV